jgi:hypothetical protein
MYHSILRSSIIELEIPFAGKTYIDTIYSTYGIDTDISLELQVLDKSDFTYSTEYTGIVDLSEWTSMRDTTSVKIIDSSVMAKFIARQQTKVPINRTTDLDGNTIPSWYYDTMTVNGVDILEQIYLEFDADAISIITANVNTSEDVEIEEIDWDESNRQYINNSGGVEEIDYSAYCDLTWDITGTGQVDMYVIFIRNGGIDEIISRQRQIDSGTGSANGTLTDSISLPDTGYIGRMYLQIDVIGTYTGSISVNNGTLQIFKTTAAAADSQVAVPMIHELGARLLQIITGVLDPLNSEVLGRTNSDPRTYSSDGDHSLIGFASGTMLRGYSFSQRPLITSFEDYYKSIDAIFNLGFWYDGTDFIIDTKETFYRDAEIISLGEVKGLEISISTKDYFNTIKCGYNESLSFDEVNGNQNFNVPTSFANDGKRIQSELDISSTYHADDYGIELARKAASSTDYSEDTKFDDQIFVLSAERDGLYNYETIQGDSFNLVTGVYSPDTRLNLDITPKRNLLRNLNRLSIPVFISKSDTEYLSKQFELALSTQKTASDAVINEKADLAYSEEPLFYPEVYNFTAPLTDAIIQQLRTDPHGYVSFDSNGVTYTGFILEVSTEPFMRKGNWTLIKRNPNR